MRLDPSTHLFHRKNSHFTYLNSEVLLYGFMIKDRISIGAPFPKGAVGLRARFFLERIMI